MALRRTGCLGTKAAKARISINQIFNMQKCGKMFKHLFHTQIKNYVKIWIQRPRVVKSRVWIVLIKVMNGCLAPQISFHRKKNCGMGHSGPLSTAIWRRCSLLIMHSPLARKSSRMLEARGNKAVRLQPVLQRPPLQQHTQEHTHAKRQGHAKSRLTFRMQN